MKLRLLSLSAIAAAIFSAILLGANPASAVAAGPGYNCTGGSIPAGSYSSISVSGACTLDAGSVAVKHDLTVRSGGALYAAFGGSNLTVGGDLEVRSKGVLVLGCEPEAFVCLNDPDQTVGTMSTTDVIRGDLEAEHALAVLVHNSTIKGRVQLIGGGGGVNCDSQDALFGSPAYATFEDNSIGKGVVIFNWQSCWLGLFRNTVKGSVNFFNNVVADPDGNEIATNTISGKLNCWGNSPAPQVGDSGGSPNTVSRGATGQCTALVGP